MKNLKEVLHLHELWVDGDPSGVRADLSGADLRGANLEDANLRNADLSNANLRNADLRNADLWGAYLWGANLWIANLSGANLTNTNLMFANLMYADLTNADLRGANLIGTNLVNAKITVFYPSRERVYYTGNGFLRIGCEYHPISKWLEDYRQIGKQHEYNYTEIDEYYQIIKKIAEMEHEKP